MKTLYELFLEAKGKYPKVTAVRYETKTLTYLELDEEIKKVAGKLKALGVKKGDLVAYNLPNCIPSVTLLYALNAIGAIAYLIHPLTPAKQLSSFLKKTNCRLLFALSINAKEYAAEIADDVTIVAVNLYKGARPIKAIAVSLMSRGLPDRVIRFEKIKPQPVEVPVSYANHAPCVYLNSGGTNGEPKVIMLSNEAIGYLGVEGLAVIGSDYPPEIKMLTVIPLFHGFGLAMGVVAPLTNGATTVLMTKFHTKETCHLLKNNLANTVIGVPALYNALLHSPKFVGKACRNLLVCYVGGDSVTESLLDRFDAHIASEGGTCHLFEGYGLTETVTVSNVNRPGFVKRGSVGKPLNGIKEKIIDVDTGEVLPAGKEGEIAIGGPSLMEGYYEDPELTKKTIKTIDGEPYVLTKDMGYIDDDGFLFFRQRLRRMAKVNGVPVCPGDIEKLAIQDKAVYECYAYPIKNEKLGSVLEVALVKHRESDDSEEEIINRLTSSIKENLPVYYLPKRIYFIEKLPRTPVGKIDTTKFPNEQPL